MSSTLFTLTSASAFEGSNVQAALFSSNVIWAINDINYPTKIEAILSNVNCACVFTGRANVGAGDPVKAAGDRHGGPMFQQLKRLPPCRLVEFGAGNQA